MKKKILSLVLALLMAASSASAVLADEAIVDEAIADVEETAVVEEVAEAGQYDKAIAFLANYGIFKGISADDLGADLDVNRYQMALFVGRISTGWVDDSKWEDGPENWSEFTDISEGAVADYWGALSYANAKGIIEGYGNGKFGPYDGITYQNALTMVVRTLGYTGLEWPWGYIEKAVSLGLTDGITDVAYTDELTRGETAQIIYNAMFAKTKNGSTLALDNFGLAFGWEKVIVTASDLNTFVTDKADAALVLKSDNATRYYKDSNKPAAGLVNFQILNDDGTLADDVYTVNAAALGLVGEHDDELAVGDAYYVLFEQNKDEEFVEVVAYEPLYTETLVNAGKTDDEGEDVDYEINEWIDAHSFVSKYSSNAYINMTKPAKDEAIVFVADNSSIEVVTGSDYAIAIDWATGDILVPVDTDKDGDWKDEWKDAKGDAKKLEYTLKYSWNDTLKKYYEVVFDRDIDKFEDVAINWISEAEMEKLLKDYTYDTKTAVKGFNKAVDGITKSAYAALRLFDTNLDGAADRGIYETYRLGYFENKGNNYGCGCGALDSYVISDVNTVSNALAAYKAKEGKDSTEIKVSLAVREEGLVCKHVADRAWIVDDSVLVAAVDEDGEETGYYAPAYVLYNYDAETGALKIVKNITAGEDADSFETKGVVRAYNVNKGTITIGEETYNFNNYAELLGNGFRYAADNAPAKAVYGALLKSLFNQYVAAVVVDGELVHIAPIGATKSDVIVVDSYAGLSSDGYIVVNGYKASELKYDQFRIGSYDGWEKGDYYYYLTEAKAEESFTKGTIYAITSYDADEDVYFVSLSGSWNDDEYEVEDDVNLYATTITSTAADNADGYMTVTIKGKTSDVKMKSTDKYIIIPEVVSGRPYTNVIVYEGKLDPTWTVVGDRINSDDPENRTYIIVNATTVIGFANNDAYKTGLVLFLNGSYTAADYDGQFAEDAYLLGAVEYEATVIDLLTGKLDAVRYATNKSLKDGHVYYTTNDVITEDAGLNGVSGVAQLEDIIDEISRIYGETDIDYAQYLTGRFNIDETNAKKFFGKDANNDDAEAWIGSTASITSLQGLVDLADATVAFEGLADLRGDAKYRKGIIGDIVYRVVNYKDNDDSKEIESIEAIDYDGFKKLVKGYEYYDFGVWFVYDVDGNIVCYISNAPDLNNKVDIADEITFTDTTIIAKADGGEDAYITASIGYKGVYDEEGYITNVIVDRIRLAFAGRDVETATHANIEDYNWFFGYEDECKKETYKAIIDAIISGDQIADVYETLVVETYDHEEDVDGCALVKVIDIRIQAVTTTAAGNTYGNFVVPVVDNAKWEGFQFVIEDTNGEWDGVYGDFSDTLVVGICDSDPTAKVVKVDTYLDLAPVSFPGDAGVVVLP